MFAESLVDFVLIHDFPQCSRDGFGFGSRSEDLPRALDERWIDKPSFLDGGHTADFSIDPYEFREEKGVGS